MATELEGDRVAKDTIVSAKRLSAKRGQALVLMALMIPIVCMMLGLIIDLGYAYGQKRQAQNAADDAALAGSQMIGKNIIAGGVTNSAVADAICEVAVSSSGNFGSVSQSTFCGGASAAPVPLSAIYLNSSGSPLTPATSVTRSGNVPPTADGVKVTTTASSPVFFAGVYGFSTFPVSAVAATLVGSAATSYNWSSPNFGPFAVWYTRANLGASVDFRTNSWCRDNARNDPNCAANPAWKGYLGPEAGPVNTGSWEPGLTGNKTGWWNSTLYDMCIKGIPMVLPVVDQVDTPGAPNGCSTCVHVVGYVALKLTSCGSQASSPNTGTVTSFSPIGVVGTGGTPPPPGLPSLRPVTLIQ